MYTIHEYTTCTSKRDDDDIVLGCCLYYTLYIFMTTCREDHTPPYVIHTHIQMRHRYLPKQRGLVFGLFSLF